MHWPRHAHHARSPQDFGVIGPVMLIIGPVHSCVVIHRQTLESGHPLTFENPKQHHSTLPGFLSRRFVLRRSATRLVTSNWGLLQLVDVSQYAAEHQEGYCVVHCPDAVAHTRLISFGTWHRPSITALLSLAMILGISTALRSQFTLRRQVLCCSRPQGTS